MSRGEATACRRNPFLTKYEEADGREFSDHFKGKSRIQERYLGKEHLVGLNSGNIKRVKNRRRGNIKDVRET